MVSFAFYLAAKISHKYRYGFGKGEIFGFGKSGNFRLSCSGKF